MPSTFSSITTNLAYLFVYCTKWKFKFCLIRNIRVGRFKFKSKGVFRCGVLMRVADRRSDRHGWMEVAANGGRQLSRVLARVVIDGGRGERGIVCCGIVGPSWKCSTCSRETVSRASLSLALSYTTVYKLSAERVLPLGCCFSLRRGEVLLYRAYPRRDIERICMYIYVYSPSPFHS